jgi:RimJ/RimL family protein N-acetyltransferase
MKHSFAPFDRECEAFLTAATHIDFANTDWSQPQWLCVSCRDDDGALMGLCLFEFKTWFDAHFSIAIRDRRCITRRVMAAMFKAVFSRARRVTALIEPWNADAIRQARLMGFQLEGYGRLLVEGERDALILGMLKSDCRYLRKVTPASPTADFVDSEPMNVEPGSEFDGGAIRSSDREARSG